MRTLPTAEPPVEPVEPVATEPRCAQCGERLTRERLGTSHPAARPLCADCACEAIPHTD